LAVGELPHFFPTAYRCVVVGSYLYFIANRQQDKFDEQGRLDVEHLHRSRVLRVKI
jgi:hypothetical protein